MEEQKPDKVDLSKIFKGDRCQKCGTKFVKYPLLGQPEKSWAENYKEKTIIWKNFFMMDTFTIIIFISILLMTYGYTHDIAKCNEVIRNPYAYCVKAGCNPNPMLNPMYSIPIKPIENLTMNIR